MKKVYLSILYLAVKAFKFHCKKTVTLAFPRVGKCLSSQKLHPLPQSLSLALSVWAASQQSPAPRFFTREELALTQVTTECWISGWTAPNQEVAEAVSEAWMCETGKDECVRATMGPEAAYWRGRSLAEWAVEKAR
jgi:hypothetical protein